VDYTSPGVRTVLADSAQPPDAGKGDVAFSSGGDQGVRGKGGYVGADGVPRLNVLDLQVCYQILKLLLPPTSCTSSLAGRWRSAVCHTSDQGHGPVSHTTVSLLVFVATALPEGSGMKHRLALTHKIVPLYCSTESFWGVTRRGAAGQ